MNKDIKELLLSEKNDYKRRKGRLSRISGRINHGINCQLYNVVHYSRIYNYYMKNSNNLFLKWYYERKYRKYAMRTNCEIYSGHIGRNFRIYHGGVIIGVNSVIKDNVKMHGHNCIGNNGKDDLEPIIGNNVNIGVGAVVIGNIELADNITVGANAVVTKSFLEPGITIAGNPARKIK